MPRLRLVSGTVGAQPSLSLSAAKPAAMLQLAKRSGSGRRTRKRSRAVRTLDRDQYHISNLIHIRGGAGGTHPRKLYDSSSTPLWGISIGELPFSPPPCPSGKSKEKINNKKQISRDQPPSSDDARQSEKPIVMQTATLWQQASPRHPRNIQNITNALQCHDFSCAAISSGALQARSYLTGDPPSSRGNITHIHTWYRGLAPSKAHNTVDPPLIDR